MSGILRQLPPGLSGFVAADIDRQRAGMGQLQAMQGILSMQNMAAQQQENAMTAPLRRQLLEAQVAASVNPREWKPVKRFNEQTGREEMVLVNLKNPSEVLPFGGQQAPNLSFQNLGGTVVGLDPTTGRQVGDPIQRTMTPGEADDAAWKRFTFGNIGAADRARIGLEGQRVGLDAVNTYYNTGMGPRHGGVQLPPMASPPPVLWATPNLPPAAPVPPAPAFPRPQLGAVPPRGAPAAPQQIVPPAPGLPPKLANEVTVADQKNRNELIAKRDFNMSGIGEIISEAEKILTGPQRPTGSTMGTAQDFTGKVFGISMPGSEQAEQLRVIGGALVARMPRMEGPQSDRDVLMYREMAGQIGDSTLPIDRRMAALDSVKRLWQKYDRNAMQIAPTQVPGGDGWAIRPVR